MILLEKINELNSLCKGTLSITSYMQGSLWVINSYGDNTTLYHDLYSSGIEASSFEEAIDKALKIVKETRK